MDFTLLKKNNSLVLALFAFVIFLSACSTSLTEEEYREISTKVYHDIEPNEVIEATVKLFKLFDGTNVMYLDNSVTVAMRWGIFGFLSGTTGKDYWTIKVKEHGNNSILVSANVLRTSEDVGIWGYSNNPSKQLQDKPTFNLFWKRLDYFLGKSTKWYTCKDYRSAKRGEVARGVPDGFCSDKMKAGDRYPDGTPVNKVEALPSAPTPLSNYVKNEYREEIAVMHSLVPEIQNLCSRSDETEKKGKEIRKELTKDYRFHELKINCPGSAGYLLIRESLGVGTSKLFVENDRDKDFMISRFEVWKNKEHQLNGYQIILRGDNLRYINPIVAQFLEGEIENK